MRRGTLGPSVKKSSSYFCSPLKKAGIEGDLFGNADNRGYRKISPARPGKTEDMLFQKSRIQFDWTKEKLTVNLNPKRKNWQEIPS